MGEEFVAEDFCTVVFDEFFYAGLTRDNVTRHLLKLLWYVYPKLPDSRLHTLVKALQPPTQVSFRVYISMRLSLIQFSLCEIYSLFILNRQMRQFSGFTKPSMRESEIKKLLRWYQQTWTI